jgi:hypothetical protein
MVGQPGAEPWPEPWQPEPLRYGGFDDLDDEPELCDSCGTAVYDGSELYAIVLDSSSVDPLRPALDGRRRLVACCPEHLSELRRYYLARPFDHDELRAQIVTRAQEAAAPAQRSLEELARATGLTLGEILGALAWRSLWFDWIPERD